VVRVSVSARTASVWPPSRSALRHTMRASPGAAAAPRISDATETAAERLALAVRAGADSCGPGDCAGLRCRISGPEGEAGSDAVRVTAAAMLSCDAGLLAASAARDAGTARAIGICCRAD